VPGVDVHAELIEHVLSGASLSRPDYARGLEVVATVIGCLLAAFAAVMLRPLGAALAILTLLVWTVTASWLAFVQAELLIDPTVPGLAMGFAFAAANVGALRRSERDKRRIREAFGRYLSPAIVETLADDPSRLKLGGEIRPITVLFSDVRGFTARSETLDAEHVLGFLNAIHAPMTDEVLTSGGTLDKFMGDGLMAFWNAPLPLADHVERALRCALAMQSTLARIEAELAREDAQAGRAHTPIAIGIGLHTGPACVGNVGSARRFDYSAIGDTVNTAARIEQTTKTYGIPIIVSQEVASAAPGFAYLRIDTVRLRGRRQESGLYALWGDAMALTDEFLAFRRLHEAALDACLAEKPDAARVIAEAERHPLGPRCATLYALYRSRLTVGQPLTQDFAAGI
jgi:adenylate cyclase